MELIARIVAGCDVIRNTTRIGLFERVQQNLVGQCHACIEVDEHNFEQML